MMGKHACWLGLWCGLVTSSFAATTAINGDVPIQDPIQHVEYGNAHTRFESLSDALRDLPIYVIVDQHGTHLSISTDQLFVGSDGIQWQIAGYAMLWNMVQTLNMLPKDIPISLTCYYDQLQDSAYGRGIALLRGQQVAEQLITFGWPIDKITRIQAEPAVMKIDQNPSMFRRIEINIPVAVV